MDYAKPLLADALAAQYVAGTLRGRARRRFESLLAAHASLRSAVRRWQDRLMPLTIVLAPQTPPLRVWQGVERVRLGHRAAGSIGPRSLGADSSPASLMRLGASVGAGESGSVAGRPWLMARQTRSGERGRSRMRTPTASCTAA